MTDEGELFAQRRGSRKRALLATRPKDRVVVYSSFADIRCRFLAAALLLCVVVAGGAIALGTVRLRASPERVSERADLRPWPPLLMTAQHGDSIVLRDASRLTLAPHTHVEVLASSAQAMLLALRYGRVSIDLNREGLRTWRVSSGAIEVDVVGKSVTLDRDAHRTRITVREGPVLVRGPGVPDGVRRLDDGDVLDVEQQSKVYLRADLQVDAKDAGGPAHFVADDKQRLAGGAVLR